MEKRIKYHLKNDKIELEIISKKVPKIITLTLFILFLISFLIPFITIALVRGQIKFGFLITIVIFGFTSYYLLKIFLWNKYGKEKFFITKNNFVFYNEFKLFKDNYLNVDFQKIIIRIETNSLRKSVITNKSRTDNQKNETGNLLFMLGEHEVRSTFQLPIKELVNLSKRILNDIEKQQGR